MPPETYSVGQQAVVGGILAIVALGLVPVAVATARHLYPQRVVFFARWGFSHLLLTFSTYLVTSYLCAVWMLGPDSSFLDMLHAGLLAQVSAGLFILIVAHRRHPELRAALGLESGGNLRAALCGLAVLLLLLPGVVGVGLIWPWLFEHLGGVYATQPVLLGFVELEGGALVWACILAVVVIPFFEELLFRGFLQPLLSQNFGEQGGVVLTAAFFAGMHPPSAFLPLFALAWMMGAVMVRTHRLVGPWTMHAAFNALNLAVFLAVPASREMLP